MSIVGLTIDYGPYAWLEHYDPDFICNHSDQEGGRYRYRAQPGICKWNLTKLAEALDPFVDFEFSSNYISKHFDEIYWQARNIKMGQKLGFLITQPPKS